jgi:hypothetical protein
MKRLAITVAGIAFLAGAGGGTAAFLLLGKDGAISGNGVSQVAELREEYRNQWEALDKEFSGATEDKGVLGDLGLDDLVRQYMAHNLEVAAFGDPVFCSYEFLGLDETDAGMNVFLWSHCTELYESSQTLKEGGAKSEPIVLVMERTAAGYHIAAHQEPELGELYASSIRDLFPARFHDKIFPDRYGEKAHNDRVRKLAYLTQVQGREFYGLQ